jgi:GR25 family glycosyltransferase involved in LPS biosynthesis
MNLRKASGSLRALASRILRATASIIPGGRIAAFGAGDDKINSILIVNLDRQPRRWRRMVRELRRFRTFDGAPLTSIVRRLAAVDARDGRAVAATADVDSTYCIGDHLYVQPDSRLEQCFGADEPIRMTRQEIAVARSHVEVWKAVASGRDNYVLVLEDDVWFRRGAAAVIDRGWRAALLHCRAEGGPRLLYMSYADAGGTAQRVDLCDAIFRPVRGLWFLSGYVLSREGATELLRAMPVVGPVDLWINYRFSELNALALSSPAMMQRQDGPSDNSYSILPFLARAGIVDAGSGPMPPDHTQAGPILVWTAGGEREGLAMALSMLGLRVRVFDQDDEIIVAQNLSKLFEEFDALINAPLTPDAISVAIEKKDIRFLLEASATLRPEMESQSLPHLRTSVLPDSGSNTASWEPLCAFLDVPQPVQPFPIGAARTSRIFRDDRPKNLQRSITSFRRKACLLDDSPWVLPPQSGWQSRPPSGRPLQQSQKCLVHHSMTSVTPAFTNLVETFPGNLASFTHEGVVNDQRGANLVIKKVVTGNRAYCSGAFASSRSFDYGRFEAAIRAATGSGLVTGFFLHRDDPRQEIDIELAGYNPRRMLVNVYFNPGDDGTEMSFGYRGSPCHIDLEFDATLDFHLYAIDWCPGRIAWSVDGNVVHERGGWDPTPVPHLPMRLHANLWAPRSEEFAGRIDDAELPARAIFKNVSVWA